MCAYTKASHCGAHGVHHLPYRTGTSVCVCVGGGGRGYIPPCKIHTGYTWRISQGGVCAIRRIRSYRPSPTSRGGEQLHSAGMYRGCLHWGVPQAAAARL